MRFGKTALALATIFSTAALAACGGATVESDDVDGTVAPLDRAPQTTPDRPGEEPGDADAQASRAPQPQDSGAQEIEEVPDPQIARTEEDVTYLEDLSGEGIDVEGVEDQLIGAAGTVCRDDGSGVDQVTVTAVAGQLVAQGRTDLEPAEIVPLIENAARGAYC